MILCPNCNIECSVQSKSFSINENNFYDIPYIFCKYNCYISYDLGNGEKHEWFSITLDKMAFMVANYTQVLNKKLPNQRTKTSAIWFGDEVIQQYDYHLPIGMTSINGFYRQLKEEHQFLLRFNDIEPTNHNQMDYSHLMVDIPLHLDLEDCDKEIQDQPY